MMPVSEFDHVDKGDAYMVSLAEMTFYLGHSSME